MGWWEGRGRGEEGAAELGVGDIYIYGQLSLSFVGGGQVLIQREEQQKASES